VDKVIDDIKLKHLYFIFHVFCLGKKETNFLSAKIYYFCKANSLSLKEKMKNIIFFIRETFASG